MFMVMQITLMVILMDEGHIEAKYGPIGWKGLSVWLFKSECGESIQHQIRHSG